MATTHASYTTNNADKEYDPYDNYGATSDEDQDQAIDAYHYGYSDEDEEDNRSRNNSDNDDNDNYYKTHQTHATKDHSAVVAPISASVSTSVNHSRQSSISTPVNHPHQSSSSTPVNHSRQSSVSAPMNHSRQSSISTPVNHSRQSSISSISNRNGTTGTGVVHSRSSRSSSISSGSVYATHLKQTVSPSNVALPASPVATRGHDSYTGYSNRSSYSHANAYATNANSVHASQVTSPVSSRLPDGYNFENRHSVNSTYSRTSHHELNSPITAISSAAANAQNSRLEAHPEEAKEDRPRRGSWEEESEDEPYEPYDYGSEDDEEEAFVEASSSRPQPHSQPQHQQQQQPQSNRYSIESNDSHRLKQQQNRFSVQSNDSSHHQQSRRQSRDDDRGDGNDLYDDYNYNEKEEPHTTHHQESYPQSLKADVGGVQNDYRKADSPRSSIDSYNRQPSEHFSRRSSRQSSRRSSYDDATGQQDPMSFYDGIGDEPAPPNPSMFRDTAVDNRVSVNSAKSSSSHIKHHSFGYNERPADYGVEPESESESESSNSDRERSHMPVQASVPEQAEASVSPVSPTSVTIATAAATAPTPSNAPASPPPVPSKSRPASLFSVASAATPSSPVTSRSAAPIAERFDYGANEEASPVSPVAPPVAVAVAAAAAAATATAAAASTVAIATAVAKSKSSAETDKAAASPIAPASSIADERAPSPRSPLGIDTNSQKSTSSASSYMDKRDKRYSGGSDTSDTSIDLHSPTAFKTQASKRIPPTLFMRTMSSASSHSRDATTAAAAAPTANNNGSSSLDKQRPISYATVFSDAEMNEVNLLDEPMGDVKQVNEVIQPTPTPSTPSAFGFSGFFGRSQPQPSTPVASSPSPAVAAAASIENRSRSTSISAFASSIQGAFSRSFSYSQPTQAPAPAVPRTPSQISQRVPNVGDNSGNGSFPRSSTSMSGDVRFSNQRSGGPGSDRASTISTRTNDSNMDLLLARLEAQNELLEKDSKRRQPAESEMDRAIGNAKAESAGEAVDWDYWGALMHDYNGVVKRNPKQLTTMIQQGVPSALRGLIWQLLAKSKDPQLETTFAELLKSTSVHEKQITRDLNRTFPNHEYFQVNGVGQEALFNVVKAYSLYDTEVGYCQGLSFIVGPLLLNMPEEEAFCMLVKMMTCYEMRGHYTPDMSVLTLRLFQFEQLMEETVPMVFKHLRNQGIRSTMYASQWFMTLFAYKFPLELVFRVYDIIFVEGIESILRFAVALLKANHDKILSLDFEVLVEFLKNGLFEYYMNDSSLLIQDAYNVKVTPRKLAQYAQKHQAMIQKQQQELAAEESLKEANRQLSAQVRQLEASMHQLNKEHVDLAKELITRKMEMAQLQDRNDVLTQKVSDLTKIVDSQAREKEEQYKGEIQDVLRKNMEYLKRNEELEDQLSYMEGLLVETKMQYAESEVERDNLGRKLNEMKKALGVA